MVRDRIAAVVSMALLLAAGAGGAGGSGGAGAAEGTAPSVRKCLRWLKQGSSKRILALRYLEEADAKQLRLQLAVDHLKDVATDRWGNATVRTRTVELLGRLAAGKLPDAKPTVARLATRILASRADKTDVRAAAAAALGELCKGDKELDKAGRKALGKVATSASEEADLRTAALEAIGRIAHADSLPAVRKSLDDADPAVKKAAQEAAKALDGNKGAAGRPQCLFA